MDTGSAHEVTRAAFMFPRFFVWLIGSLMTLLTLMGGIVVAQIKSASEEAKQKVDRHEERVNDHAARLLLLEQSQRDLKETSRDTNSEVKEIRRMIESQIRRERSENGGSRR